jgi:hypothetical protein
MSVRSVIGCSKSPNSNFLVRIRDTASSMRDIDTRLALTSPTSAAMNSRKFAGCMNMSTPALTAVRTCVLKSPGIWSIAL